MARGEIVENLNGLSGILTAPFILISGALEAGFLEAAENRLPLALGRLEGWGAIWQSRSRPASFPDWWIFLFS
jgi:hypothetical protein